MDLPALEAFVCVASSGSFSEASLQLHLTQPAISKRVAQLERELGERLFDRLGRQVILTEAGRTLLPRARQILTDAHDAIRALDNLRGEVGGTLTLASSHYIGLHRLPPVLRVFSARYPHVNLDLRFLDSEQACVMVGRGELELALVTLPNEASADLVVTPVWQDHLRLAVAEDHALAAQSSLDFSALAGYPAILPPTGSYTRELIDHRFRSLGLRVSERMSTRYLETIKMMVTVGLGWSVLPETLLDSNLIALAVNGFNIERKLGVVQHRRRTPSNAAIAMLALLAEQSHGADSTIPGADSLLPLSKPGG